MDERKELAFRANLTAGLRSVGAVDPLVIVGLDASGIPRILGPGEIAVSIQFQGLRLRSELGAGFVALHIGVPELLVEAIAAQPVDSPTVRDSAMHLYRIALKQHAEMREALGPEPESPYSEHETPEWWPEEWRL